MDKEKEMFGTNTQRTSLPPRSSIHAVNNKSHDSEKKSSIYMLLASFAFIVIIATFVYGQFTIFDDPKPDSSSASESQNNNSPNSGAGDNNQDTSNQVEDSNIVKKPEEDTQEDEAKMDETGSSDGENNNEDTVMNDDPEDQIHVIKTGENLYRISLAYYSSGNYYLELAKYNNLSSPDAIYAGLTIKIPKVEKIKD